MPDGDDELEELIRGVKDGDPKALGELYERTRPLMMNIVSHQFKTSPYVNRDPEDVVQEAWLRLLPYISDVAGKPKPVAHFVGLVSTTMRNLLIDAIRLKETSLRKLESDILEQGQAQGLTPSRDYAAQQAFGMLAEAIRRLDTDRQELVRLYYEQGMTVSEIADLLNDAHPENKTTADAVRGRLYRIRADLKEVMGASTLYYLPGSNRATGNAS